MNSVILNVVIYLAKLRTGYNNQNLVYIFVNNKHSIAERLMKSARNAITTDFTPQYLGFSHVNRDQILEKCTNMSCKLLLPKETSLKIIWDGIYVYIHKNSNNVFQRSCYNMHKQSFNKIYVLLS